MKKVFLKIYFGNLSRTLVLFSLLPLFTYGQDIESLNKKECKLELTKYITITDSLNSELNKISDMNLNLNKELLVLDKIINNLKNDSLNKSNVIDDLKIKLKVSNEKIDSLNKIILESTKKYNELKQDFEQKLTLVQDSNRILMDSITELKSSNKVTTLSNDSTKSKIYSFKTVNIGNQNWMAENLNVDKFRNGEKIPQAKSAKEWSEMKGPKWCYYNFDHTNGEKYGKLYNWEAIRDPRGITPKGWHVPTDKEWSELFNFYYNQDKFSVENKLKSIDGWNTDESGYRGGNNESGFNGLPAGKCQQFYGTSQGATFFTEWWSSSLASYGSGFTYKIPSEYNDFVIQHSNLDDGHSIRCIEDKPTNIIKIDGLKAVKINDQIWLVDNLNVSKFSNGEIISQAKNFNDWKKYCDNKTPAWCFYDFKDENGKKYGKIYNYYAVSDIRNIAPVGWRIPKPIDWDKMIESIGGSEDAGTKMKINSSFKNDWATNSSEFGALAGGELEGSNMSFPSFTLENWGTGWWSDYGIYDNDRIYFSISKSSSGIRRDYDDPLNKYRGLYVRCIKNP